MKLPSDRKKNLWTREQLKLAFHLYCQLPFGKLDMQNPEIITLANLVGRTPSAVAMKLVNFASLDPNITSTGRRGLSNVSAADRAIWDEFHADWEGLDAQCIELISELGGIVISDDEVNPSVDDIPIDYVGQVRVACVDIRIKQSFFRRSVLSSYQGRCCMSGLSAKELIVASHIIPWAEDSKNRLNPHNGMCLSAIHDKAFDRGLITVMPDMVIRVSHVVRKQEQESKLGALLVALDGKKITLPQRFWPSPEFLSWHNRNLFKG